MDAKLIIFSAPSGSGKSTIIKYLLEQNLGIEFSISATSRPPRGNEQNGVEYYFMNPEAFKAKIISDDFLEYQEVYKDLFYGTLKSEVERIAAKGSATIFDVDVLGGLNIKNIYGNKALTIFVQPPSLLELRRRLERRGTDSPEIIAERLAKAEFEMTFADKYDKILVNDKLQDVQREATKIIREFLLR